jgi:hypothetical protein
VWHPVWSVVVRRACGCGRLGGGSGGWSILARAQRSYRQDPDEKNGKQRVRPVKPESFVGGHH